MSKKRKQIVVIKSKSGIENCLEKEVLIDKQFSSFNEIEINYLLKELNGFVISKLVINIENAQEARLCCQTIPKAKGKGSATLLIKTMLADIFEKGLFDDIIVKSKKKEEVTQISNVKLIIDESNKAGISLAKKCGFEMQLNNNLVVAEMSKEKYFDLIKSASERDK